MSNVTVGYQEGCLAPLFITEMSFGKARDMGIETVWVPDHFMGFVPKWLWKPEICAAAKVIHSGDAFFDPVAVLGWAAAKFPGMTLGTSVTEPIRRHPGSLAQSFVTLDHMTKGNAILGIGNGLVENTEPYGLPHRRRVARLEEALEVLDLLFSSEGRPLDFEGRFYQLNGAIFDLPLFEGRPPRIFVGSHAPRMLRLTGRFASGWLPGQVVSGQEYARRLEIIHAAANDAGRSTTAFLPCQTMLLVIDDSAEIAIEKALASPYVAYNALSLPGAVWREQGLDHPYGDDFAGPLDMVPSRTEPKDVELAQTRLTPELLRRQYYLGTPGQIAEQVADLATVGCGHFILANVGGNFTGRATSDFTSMGELAALLRSM